MTGKPAPIIRPNGWTDHDAAAAALQAQPGVWLLVAANRGRCNAKHIAGVIRHGQWTYGPAGAYEARVELKDDLAKVYARYVGAAGGGQ